MTTSSVASCYQDLSRFSVMSPYKWDIIKKNSPNFMSYNLALMFPIHSVQQIRTYITKDLFVHKPNLINTCCADMKKNIWVCHNVAHAMIAQLSWHVKNCDVLDHLTWHLQNCNMNGSSYSKLEQDEFDVSYNLTNLFHVRSCWDSQPLEPIFHTHQKSLMTAGPNCQPWSVDCICNGSDIWR